MKRFTIALALALLATAVAQVPVTRWHNNAALELPYGAMRSDGAECARLIELVGQAGNETGVCYGWIDSLDGAIYPLFTLMATNAGYVIADERVLPEPTRGVMLVLVDATSIELVFWLYDGPSVAAVAFTEPRD